ncbi:MAG: SUMF1/EgtB/PvdO family nonheme iron enzyme [Chitinispirillales bacterium]|jgi:formylglycine-generating enzyme required for sulfatase activity|nr:SUMF1/EgtB/PvdO family nonheme iron enzyme [Chitinispirillales bacterium]
MKTSEKFMVKSVPLLSCLCALIFWYCAKIPDHCSDHNVFDPNTQFCSDGVAHDKCNGKEYDPRLGNPCSTNTHTLTVHQNPIDGGTVSPGGMSTHNAGTSVTVTAMPNSNLGYSFTGWTGVLPAGIDASSPSVTFNINSNVSIIANFQHEPVAPDIEMVFVENGEFIMGCVQGRDSHTDGSCLIPEVPSHWVTLTNSYSIGKYQVTQAQWFAVMGDNPSHFNSALVGANTDLHPVERVSWYNVQTFINRLNMLSGLQYRLPTEAEWEFAARGGNSGLESGYRFSGSNDIDDVAWHSRNSNGTTHPIGRRPGNELGIFDMSGNVWEWVSDRSTSNYEGREDGVINPTGPPSGTHHVFRGGSWGYGAGVSYRGGEQPDFRDPGIGFRLVLAK